MQHAILHSEPFDLVGTVKDDALHFDCFLAEHVVFSLAFPLAEAKESIKAVFSDRSFLYMTGEWTTVLRSMSNDLEFVFYGPVATIYIRFDQSSDMHQFLKVVCGCDG